MKFQVLHLILAVVCTLVNKVLLPCPRATCSVVIVVCLSFKITFLMSDLGFTLMLITLLAGLVTLIYVYCCKRSPLCEERKQRSHYVNNFYEKKRQKQESFDHRKIQKLCFRNGIWLTEADGRIIRFRGINLPAKTPRQEKPISFIDKPFPLKEASEHFSRLSNFGYNLIRLGVAWEAVMHEGPNMIDEEYLKYLSKLVDIAHEKGLYVLIDPHQDVWSRLTGGDGAPQWTLDACGFKTDGALFHETGCAVLHKYLKGTPKMQWPTNYYKLITGTMFTLFFAGDMYAPNQKVAGMSFQQYLQSNYLIYLRAVAKTLRAKDNVIGFGTMNEPNCGFVGQKNLRNSTCPVPFGHVLSTFESMQLGIGKNLKAPYFSTPFVLSSIDSLNPNQLSVWKSEADDVWRNAGVYTIDDNSEPILVKPNHFDLKGDDFVQKCMKPFYERVQCTISEINPNFVTFAEPHMDASDPFVAIPKGLNDSSFAYAPHFYDFLMLVTKRFFPWLIIDIELEIPILFPWFVNWTLQRNLKHLKDSGRSKHHVLLGEIGIPFDMGVDVDYEAAMDRILSPVEDNDVDFTLWCYFSDNTVKKGDDWNGENLSIRMREGNRGLLSAVRPFVYQYPSNIKVISQKFDPFSQTYKLMMFSNQSQATNEKGGADGIEVFVPKCHFQGLATTVFTVSTGSVEYKERSQTLTWTLDKKCTLQISLIISETSHKTEACFLE